MSTKPNKKPFQKFGAGGGGGGGGGHGGGGGRGGHGGGGRGGRRPFNKFKKGGSRNQRFIQNAKGYGKKGNYGRGTHIEEEEFTYFMGILEAQQRTPFGSCEEKVAMANNVMEQTKDKEIHLSSNQVVSKVLENLLAFVDTGHLERYFEVFGEGLRPVCSDVYSSHVLQKLMETAFVRAVGISVEDENNIKTKRPRTVISELKFNTSQDFAEEHRNKCSEFVLRICKFLLNNLEEFVMDPNACYLLRAAILTLAGVHIPKTLLHKGKAVSNSEKYNGLLNFHRMGEFKLDKTDFKVPAEWTEILMEFPGRLQMWPQFKDFPYNNRTSVLLQVICIALHTADKKALDDFGKKLITDTFIDVEIPKAPLRNQPFGKANEDDEAKNGDEGEANGNGNGVAGNGDAGNGDAGNGEEKASEEIKQEEDEADIKEEAEDEQEEEEEEDDGDKEKPSVFKSDSAVRLLQSLISVASPELLTEISPLFKDRLISLTNNKYGIFAVQRLINYVLDKSEFEKIFDELCPHFEKFLQSNRANLVCSLSATCLRLKTKQAAFITALQNTLHCNASLGEDHPKAFFNCLIKLKPFEVLPYENKTYIGLFGSLIIQDILQFNKPIFLVNSILETPVKKLVEILLFPNGSFIADKFLSSPTIGEKSREKFVKLFEGFYMDLALAQSGSRVLELLFKASNDTQRVVIGKELTGKENKLKGSAYGRIVYNALRLETFKLSQDQWKASWTAKKDGEAVEVKQEGDEEKPAVEKMETDTTEESVKEEPTKVLPKKGKANKKNNKRPAS